MKINREIDQRLIDRGTKIIEANVSPGNTAWKLVEAKFFPAGNGKGFSGGRHHVYVEAVDENGNSVSGVEFKYSWPVFTIPIVTNGKTGFDAANQPFSPGKNAFTISKDNGDTVVGIGMGQDDPDGWNAGQHTSTLLRYQRMIEKPEEDDGIGDPPEIPPDERNLLATIYLYDDGSYELKNEKIE